MSPFLDAREASEVRERVARLEAATGIESVTAVIARADSYPEIPWKAFALGASLSALVTAAWAWHEPGWEASAAVVRTVVAVLAAGGAAALATMWIAPFARLFLPRAHREVEVLQYAQALFLERELFKTRRHDGILLLVSLFERQVAVVADHGVRDKVGANKLASVVAAVTSRIADGEIKDAMVAGLERLEEVLLAHGFSGAPGRRNEIPDDVVQQRGSS